MGAHASQLPETLRQHIDRHGPFSLPDALGILQGLVDQVGTLHVAGRIHREISADCVTLDEKGQPCLGPAKPLVSVGGVYADPTENPPELRLPRGVFLPDDVERARQILQQAGASIDPRRIDIYQLGVLSAYVLTGAPVSQYLRSPQVAGSVPPAARSVIDRALGCAAESPTCSCAELRQALLHVAASLRDAHGETAGQPDSRVSERRGHAEDLPFERLAHFRILDRIGAGGMGDVYQGFDETLHRFVAIKVLPAELARHEEFVRRFRAEATAAAGLAHPNIVPIYFIGQEGPHHFFAMQFVEGESLADRLRRESRLSAADAVRVLQDCLHGLSTAHRQGMIHRDIKPGNILLEARTQRAMLADFGLVHRLDKSTRLTATGTILGTVDYIAPEQARGQTVDGRADLYALGVLFYQMLSGRLPFEADTPTAMLFQHAYEPPLALEQAAPGVNPLLAAITARLMAKKPEDRYQDCQEVLAALEPYLAGKRPPVPSPGALSAVIPAPDFGVPPPLPVAAAELARPRWWQAARDRLASLLRARAPALIQELQNTEQRVDGAVDEYERRRRRLAALIEQAQGVAQELADHGRAFQAATVAAAKRFQAAVSDGERAEALEDQQRSERAAADVQVRVREQEDQLDGMRVQLAQVDARLAELRSQRDLLLARLKVARARLQMAEARPRARRLRWAAALAVCAIALLATGLVLWRVQKDTSPVASGIEKREWKPALEPAPVVEEPAVPLPPKEAPREPAPKPLVPVTPAVAPVPPPKPDTAAAASKPPSPPPTPLPTEPPPTEPPPQPAEAKPFAPDQELLDQIASAPVQITDFDPKQGAPGHLVTLQGQGFRETQRVFFTVSGRQTFDRCAKFQVLSDSEMRVEVPPAVDDRACATITVVTPHGVTVTLPPNPTVVDRATSEEASAAIASHRSFFFIRGGGVVTNLADDTTAFIADGGTLQRAGADRCLFVQPGGLLLRVQPRSVVYREPGARLGEAKGSRIVEVASVSLSPVSGLFEYVLPPSAINARSDEPLTIRDVWPRSGAIGQVVTVNGTGFADTKAVFAAIKEMSVRANFRVVSDHELHVEIPPFPTRRVDGTLVYLIDGLVYLFVITPGGATGTVPTPAEVAESAQYRPGIETKEKVLRAGAHQSVDPSLTLVEPDGVLSFPRGVVFLKRGATLERLNLGANPPVVFEPGAVILDPKRESSPALFEVPAIELSPVPRMHRTADSHHHLTEQTWPVVDWMSSMASGFHGWLQPLFSARLRPKNAEIGWQWVHGYQRRFVEEKFQVSPLYNVNWSDEWDFLYTGSDSSGEVLVSKPGGAQMKVRVILEDGEWKIDDEFMVPGKPGPMSQRMLREERRKQQAAPKTG